MQGGGGGHMIGCGEGRGYTGGRGRRLHDDETPQHSLHTLQGDRRR